MNYIASIENCSYLNIIDEISLNIEKSKFYSVVGKKACGKTSFLRLLNKEIDEVNVSLICHNTLENSYYNQMAELNVDILDKYNIEYKKHYNLNIEQKIIIQILRSIDNGCDLLLIDDLFVYLSPYNKNKLFDLFRSKELTIIFSTTNEEEILYSDKILLLENKVIKRADSVSDLLKYEMEYKTSGVTLPFMKDLNAQLISYELIEEECLDCERLVDEIWN